MLNICESYKLKILDASVAMELKKIPEFSLTPCVIRIANAILMCFSPHYRNQKNSLLEQNKFIDSATHPTNKPLQVQIDNVVNIGQKSLRLGTYNILKPESPQHLKQHPEWYHPHKYMGFNAKGESNWDSRKQTIVRNIVQANLDLICIQEVVKGFVPELDSTLKDKGYSVTWIGHTDKDSPWEHGVAVAYKIQKFEKIIEEHGIFISDHLKTKSGSDKPRRHQIVELRDRISNKIIRVASVHLLDTRDIKSNEQRPEQISKIIQDLECRPADIQIIAGDLNQDQFGDKVENQRVMIQQPTKSSLEKALEEHDYHTDGSLEPTNCYRDTADFDRIRKGKRKIDWIFVKGKIESLRPVSKSEFQFNPTASDHFMTATDIVLEH